MRFAVAGALLDACVLGVLCKGATYGYDLTQRIQGRIDVSESTLYPVLRRLLKEGFLEAFDEPFDGRNRRYYTVTDAGEDVLRGYCENWQGYKENVENLLLKGGVPDDDEQS